MANFNPLGYTGKVPASLTRLGVCQFNPVDFSVSEDGVVSLGGTGAVQTINSLLPTAGNIVIAGTALQVTVSSAGSTITLSLPAAITTPGSLTTTSTLGAGTSLSAGTTITAGTGITSTTGNITATAGNVAAGAAVTAATTVTAGTGITATTGNIVATAGAVNAGTSMTATAGDITATLGHVVIAGAAKQLQVEGGAVTDFVGQATLVAGTVTIANTNIAAGDRVFVSRSDVNGSTALGVFDVSITPATSFTIDARNPTDATVQTNDISIVDYFIVRQL